jgi:hypothetical protein
VPQQIFAAPLQAFDALPRQIAIELGRHRPAQPMVAHDHRLDPLAFDVRRQCAPGHFDFG